MFKYTDQFSGKEVRSDHGYLRYSRPNHINEQISALRSFFPNLDSADITIANGKLLDKAEGWFAIPRWEKIAPTYGEAVQKVLDLIKQTRHGAFYDHFQGELKFKHLRQLRRCSDGFQVIGDQQKSNDILIIPAQFGMRHAGISAGRALSVMESNEFALGPFAVGIMLLTHPKRLMGYHDIGINCSGAELFGIQCVKEKYHLLNLQDLIPIFWFDVGSVYFDKFFFASDNGASSTPSAFFSNS